MEFQHGHDLGRGVRVIPTFDGGWQVRSRQLQLPWAERSGHVPGSAVIWLGEPFEVVAVSRTASGERWDLGPWPENEVMRGVFHLGESAVEALHNDQAQGRKRAALWWLTVPVLPVVGLAPGKIQQRWASEWGFPSTAATLLSAVVELAMATLGAVHLVAEGMAGVGFLPPMLSWLGFLSPALFIESVVRLKHLTAHQQPIGSVVGLPLALVAKTEPMPDPPADPEVRRADPQTGELEIWSPIHRSDWTSHGVLRFRDEDYEIDKLEAFGRGWLYHFKRGQPDGETVQLRLAPSQLAAQRESSVGSDSTLERQPGLVATAGLTALACMAPRDLQERWANRIDVHPLVLTLLGAGAEMVGGVVNLRVGQPEGGSWWLAVDVFVLCEGLVRCILLVLSGRPVGSVLGMVLGPLLEAWMPDGDGG